MKISREILNQLDLDEIEEREPVNVVQVAEVLQYLRQCAKRIADKSRLYVGTKDADIQLDCIDIVTAKINDFTQAFRDLVIFMRKEEDTYNGSTSLRYCVRSYDGFGFQQTEQEEVFLNEILIRNEITHDYFNVEVHRQKLIAIMENCAEGGVDICYNLEKYCKEHKLMERYIEGIR